MAKLGKYMEQMQQQIHEKMGETATTEEIKTEAVTEEVAEEVKSEATQEEVSSLTENKTEEAEVIETTEAPKAETTQEVVSEDVEDKVPTNQTNQPTTEFKWDELAKEEGWISPQELESKLSEYKQMTEKPTNNDLINKLVELDRSGKKIDIGFIARQMIDYDTLDVTNESQARELIKQSLKTKNPDLTTEEIDFEMRVKYKDLQRYSDDPESEEYRDALERLQFDAQKAKRELKRVQQEESLPNPDAGYKKVEEDAEKQRKEFQQFWSSEVPKQTKGKNKYSVQLKEGDVEYELSEPQIKRLNKYLKENLSHASEYFDAKSGTWDWDGMWEGAVLKDKDIMGSVIQKAVDQFTAKGKEDLTKQLKNTKTETQTKPSSETNSETEKVKKSMANMYERLGIRTR